MPGETLQNKSKATDEAHPFGLPWLDSCYQETLLPNGSWQKVRHRQELILLFIHDAAI